MADFKPRISYGSGPTTITFALPPEGDPFGERNSAKNVTTEAGSGALQNSQLHQLEFRTIRLTFVTEALTDAFRTFFETWGSLKKEFTYYPHGDTSTDSITCTLVDNDFTPARILPGASSDFLYEFEFTLRRVK